MENLKRLDDYLTIRDAAQVFPFSESALRHMLFLNKEGFRDKVAIKIGKKILIKKKEFIEFIESHSV